MIGNRKNHELNQSDGRSAFTLIEVMIALVVLAIGLMALTQLQMAAIGGLAYSRHSSIATQLAEGQLEHLMSLPFPDTEVNNVSYYPKDDAGTNIEAQTSGSSPASPFFDGLSAGNVGDSLSTRLWLSAPVNDRGQPAARGETAYLVTWTVERGGSLGTPPVPLPDYGFPGPYQIYFVVSVLWFEKGDKVDAFSFVRQDSVDWGKRTTIEGIRELSTSL